MPPESQRDCRLPEVTPRCQSGAQALCCAGGYNTAYAALQQGRCSVAALSAQWGPAACCQRYWRSWERDEGGKSSKRCIMGPERKVCGWHMFPYTAPRQTNSDVHLLKYAQYRYTYTRSLGTHFLRIKIIFLNICLTYGGRNIAIPLAKVFPHCIEANFKASRTNSPLFMCYPSEPQSFQTKPNMWDSSSPSLEWWEASGEGDFDKRLNV